MPALQCIGLHRCRSRVVSLAGALLLAACAPTIKLPAPETALPARFEASPAGREGVVSLDRWWASFADPQLVDLIETALTRSTTARIAHARIVEARALRGLDRAAALPSGALASSAGRQGSFALGNDAFAQQSGPIAQAAFAPSWEVDLFGRVANIRARADLNYEAARLDYYGVRLALAADVATSLFRARLAAADLAAAREREWLAHELARTGELAELRGLLGQQDLARLEAELATAQAVVPRSEAELFTAKRSLLILTGRPNTATDALDIEPKLDVPPALPGSTPGSLLARRPDVLRARALLLSAARTVEVDRLALFPRLTLNPVVSVSDIPGSAGGLWSLAAGLSVPVLDRARLMSQLRVSEARGIGAVAEYERAVQAAFGEAENALTQVSADHARLPRLEAAEVRSRAAFAAARKGYAAGLTDLTTLLQVERTWLQNRDARDAARAGRLIGTVDAIRALGGGWDPSSSELPLPAPRSATGDH